MNTSLDSLGAPTLKSAKTLDEILARFRAEASSSRDLGDKFERLIVEYLRTDPLYKERFSEVWLWNEWPARENRPDTGIDIVSKERNGDGYCAVQCKFFDPSHQLQKSDIDSFFTASGKEPFTSRLIVSTTDNWSEHAEEAMRGQKIPVSRLRLKDLAESPIDWGQFTPSRAGALKTKDKKKILPHQKSALEDVIKGFKSHARGKLIMACGTGKTFTALKIAEKLVPPGGSVLYLLPSISLVSQTLREWTAEAESPLLSFVVCSDAKVGKKSETEDISAHDLAYPATTNAEKLARQAEAFADKKRRTVIFSTYQSIQVVSAAQKKGLPEFDLIICDEAHRTTGVTILGEDESHFVRVHDQNFIRSKKRLYMTATPRIYTDEAKSTAKESNAVLCSMNDEDIYGPEFHRLGFSEAVRNDLLADYKVMVLAVDEKFVSKTFQKQIADKNNEIKLEDAVKITGCLNGLSKRFGNSADGYADQAPMRRAVAFARSIKDSKKIKEMFAAISQEYQKASPAGDGLISCEVEHVDGTFNALKRNEKLDWLKAEPDDGVCRILSNARCLSEGVDVPALDAVLFLNPRNSVVDVVQSVGRVMRKAPGKKYGYIILPVGIPAGIPPEEALKDNERYRVVWQVLQALRAHDDRFNATINKIELNEARPEQIQIIGVGGPEGKQINDKTATQLVFNLSEIEEWRNVIYAKIVLKCGERLYWEQWAKDVAQIAERHVARIKAVLEGNHPKARAAFSAFLKGLQKNINPSINEDAAVEMLSQHLITKPVFDALFQNEEFTRQNPVSVSMQKMLDALDEHALEKETAALEKFYESVKERAQGIDTPEGRQRVITELYEKFFRAAFPKMAERLGIVYTPIEVVDFILKSANQALKDEFGLNLGDEGVHILDPFTGTGTFIVRLLQSGLISPKDLSRKYEKELHANEIVLLAYYIAAINIEEAYHSRVQGGSYQPFNGIVLTDTFQLSEGKGEFEEPTFRDNNKRASRQNKTDIRVIIGNPPYSAKQTSENDANKNLEYPQLDQRIRETYANHSSATLKTSLYDSYIRAIRWASDRIKNQGVIGFVTNGSFIDGNAADGLRQCLAKEFSSIYCFNLRGNQRTQGETSRREGGKIFGSGSRAGIAITLLIKNPDHKGPCQIFYHDIGDYLSREEKLKIISDFENVQKIPWKTISPNKNHDWINQRDPAFEKFIPMGDKKDGQNKTVFDIYSRGIATSRDAWTYNFSKKKLAANMRRMIDFYNQQVEGYQRHQKKIGKTVSVEDFVDNDPTKISWTRALKNDIAKGEQYSFNPNSIVQGMYRPYCKQWMYFNREFNEMVLLMPRIFPEPSLKNWAIAICGLGVSKDFSAIITDCLPDIQLQANGQCFPLYFYEKEDFGELFAQSGKSGGYVKKDAINDEVLHLFQKTYEPKISKEDIFYYVYGLLHSPEYKKRFEADLKKMLPRIPKAQDFWAFSRAGRELAHWHLNYETVQPYPLKEFSDPLNLDPKKHYRVEKMRFGKKGKEEDRTTIIYNSHLTLSGIPLEAYEYVVNGRPALEWIMERYQVSTDKDSGIINDPNDYSEDPRYIVDLLKRVVRVSLETVKIVKDLPALREV